MIGSDPDATHRRVHLEPFGDPRQKIVRQQDDAACGVVCAPSRWEEALLLRRRRHSHWTPHFRGQFPMAIRNSRTVVAATSRGRPTRWRLGSGERGGERVGERGANADTCGRPRRVRPRQISCHQHADTTTGMQRCATRRSAPITGGGGSSGGCGGCCGYGGYGGSVAPTAARRGGGAAAAPAWRGGGGQQRGGGDPCLMEKIYETHPFAEHASRFDFVQPFRFQRRLELENITRPSRSVHWCRRLEAVPVTTIAPSHFSTPIFPSTPPE